MKKANNCNDYWYAALQQLIMWLLQALVPTLLTPHNKYAIIYLRAAGSQEAWGKTPHSNTHTYLALCFTLKNTRITRLLKGTLNYPLLYVSMYNSERWLCVLQLWYILLCSVSL